MGILIPLMDIKRQQEKLKNELDEAIKRVMMCGEFIAGQENQRFEEKMQQATSTKYAIGVNSGTDALILSLKAAGIGPGDEVITTPYTFFATVEAILQVGARPVFVDIDPSSYLMEVSQLEAAVTSKTKAIIPVHLFGLPVNLAEIRRLSELYDLVVIQDSCQAAGATFQGRPVETWGDLSCLSFYPTKNLGGCGDGGMILTNNAAYAKTIRLLKTHGTYKKYHHSAVGYNSRLDEIQAAILSVKLDHLKTWNAERQRNAQQFIRELAGLPLQLPPQFNDREHVYHLFVVKTERAEALKAYLQKYGIGTGIYYPLALHQQKALENQQSHIVLPQAEAVAGQTIAFPIFPELTDNEKAYIVDKVREFFSH
ncbi:glutamine--scyllo-inositol aminotransferase [Pullulanibacillus camelliae]|uniref:Glutamine--scyllo-inositol aminotransferase n=1 Tax=Pullulanibacillus camelliae TaxID=1707096 RepID=A0A8J2W133_9BACL|nr:DegT/DnrJ/EryC1/StrS family aminotransferase [Pullulanibacillus camelliae]GGE41662.1 glutamine--scyllo-inositol aminotransferase [Pullulanibacillus camelliae]